MMNDGHGDICLLIVFPIASYIEKTWIKFKSTGLKNIRVVVSLIGLTPLFMMIKWMKKPLDNLLGSHWGHFLYSFIVVMYCITLYPIVIKLVANRNKDKNETTMEAIQKENITVSNTQYGVTLTIKAPTEIVLSLI